MKRAGQKQRVSLARVLYARPSVALLDDVFSALDAETAKSVFDALFGSEGALKGQATVLVTHATRFLQRMGKVLVLSEGRSVFVGTHDELRNTSSTDITLSQYLITSKEEEEKFAVNDRAEKQGDDEKEKLIMTAEEREFGLSKFSHWLTWLKYAGGWPFIFLQILFLLIDRFFYVCSEWWIARWSEASVESIGAFGREFPPQTDGRSAQIQYVVVFLTILAFSITATSIRSHWGGEKQIVVMVRG